MSEPAPAPAPAPAPSPAPAPAPAPALEQSVPYSRFAALVQERDALKSQIGTVQEQLAQAEGRLSTVDTITAQLAAKTTELDASKAALTTYRTIASRGFLDDGVASALEAEHARLPKTNRPDLGAWLDAFKADPTTIANASALIRPHLESVFGKSQTPAQPRGGHGAAQHQPGAGSAGGQQAVSDLTLKLQRNEITREQFSQQMAALRRPAS